MANMSEVVTGRPLQIIKSVEDNFVFEDNDLQKILENDEIKDHYIVVVSVSGAFRKGKSFLLGFFIRYLEAMYVKKDATNWIGSPDQSLQGFSWESGPDRNTTGILMWSEVFVHENGDDKIAIILLDTQGVFDHKTTPKNCAVIFALSTLLSSVQIYNLSGNIQENDLQNLQLFTEYGRLALENSTHTPFQKLLFLIRDWNYPYVNEFGPVGGDRLIHKLLETSEDQHNELTDVRKHLKSCFSKIECFLMPHPGMKMVMNELFDGRPEDISKEFLENLEVLVQMVLSPDRLTIKQINGENVRFKELVRLFKLYLDILTGNELPDPKSILDATADVDHLKILSESKEIYEKEMKKICETTEMFTSDDFKKHHNQIKSKLLEQYDNKKKMGGPNISLKYRDQLEEYLDDFFHFFKQQNNYKNEKRIVLFNCHQISAIFEAKNFYNTEMEDALRQCRKSDEFIQIHNNIKSKAFDMFIGKCNQHNIEYKSYLNELTAKIEELFLYYKTQNDNNLKLEEDQTNKESMELIHAVIHEYEQEMESVLEMEDGYLSIERFESTHVKIKSQKINMIFEGIADKEEAKKHSQSLDKYLNNLYNIFRSRFSDRLQLFKSKKEAEYFKVINELRRKYIDNMNGIVSQSNSNITFEELLDEHTLIKNEIVKEFESLREEGDENLDKYLYKLVTSIDEVFSIYQLQQRKYKSSWMTTIKDICLPVFSVFTPMCGIIMEVASIFVMSRRGGRQRGRGGRRQ